jgi:cell division protein FtsI (penicillin-binding protein 3)
MIRGYGRFGVILIVIFLLYAIAIGRLFYWQVIRSSELKDIGINQSAEIIEIPAIRGQILTSDNFPLATNTISYLLYSNPKLIENGQEFAGKLSKILDIEEASLAAHLDQDLYWVKLADNLTPDKKREIEKVELPGIGFQQQFSRLYPEASMAAHLLGFVGRDLDGSPRGYFGVEGEYNNLLSGRDGALYAIKDALGNQVISDIREDLKIDGRNVKLTIDRVIQFATNTRLKNGVDQFGAKGGSVIIMDTKTGKIIAMASYPDFDPNFYYEFSSESYSNPILSNVFEPGSTFKVLIMAAAFDSDVVKSTTRCDICSGPIDIGEYTIKTWNDEYKPNSTMRDVIIHSDNTGMVFVGRKLGLDRIRSYIEKFGLLEATGIDLQGETTGTLSDKTWYPIDIATSSFGQGISVTPLQLISAINSLANGGKLMKPYVVDSITTDDNQTITIKPEFIRKTVSNKASKMISSIMVDAVNEGESQWVKVDNYKIAGKTGTAQIPVAGHYDPDQTIASFVGFFPADNPQFTMLVLVDRPKTSIYGSETAAPIFFNIARDIIKYKNLPSK